MDQAGAHERRRPWVEIDDGSVGHEGVDAAGLGEFEDGLGELGSPLASVEVRQSRTDSFLGAVDVIDIDVIDRVAQRFKLGRHEPGQAQLE